jgi:hypothetical protein
MSVCRIAVVLAGLVVGIAPLAGQEIWTLHGFDYGLLRTEKLEVDLHTRFRTSKAMSNYQQGRSGAVLRWKALPRLSAIGGYYFGQQEDGFDEWALFHRPFGGAEAIVYRDRRFKVASRTLVERFIATPGADFNRYRLRTRMAMDGRVAPYLSSEWFFDHQGVLSARHGGGVRWKWARWGWTEFGYLYDDRSPRLGPPRHMLITQVWVGPVRE